VNRFYKETESHEATYDNVWYNNVS
jgi:hypothetical protein